MSWIVGPERQLSGCGGLNKNSLHGPKYFNALRFQNPTLGPPLFSLPANQEGKSSVTVPAPCLHSAAMLPAMTVTDNNTLKI